MLDYLFMLRWAVLLKLKEPCLWREDQISNQTCMRQHACTHTHTYTHFFLTPPPPHPHHPNNTHLHTNTGYSGDATAAQKHTWRNRQTQQHYLTPTHSQGDPDDLLTVQYLHCRALGVSGVRSCMRNNGPLHLSASSNQTTKHKAEPTEGSCTSQQMLMLQIATSEPFVISCCSARFRRAFEDDCKSPLFALKNSDWNKIALLE